MVGQLKVTGPQEDVEFYTLSNRLVWTGTDDEVAELLNVLFSPNNGEELSPADGDMGVVYIIKAAAWFKAAGDTVTQSIMPTDEPNGRIY